MVQKGWFFAAPLLLVLGGLGGRALWTPLSARGADQRIIDPKVAQMEEGLGYHLYAPTWLPYHGTVGSLGVRKGAHRILQDYSDDHGRSVCILAQERRNAVRDKYHRRIFQEAAEATADLEGKGAYFVTGSNGERRLFWNEKDNALILSSSFLTDPELLAIARKVR